MIRKIGYKILDKTRKSSLGIIPLSLLIRVHNFSYNWIKFFSNKTGEHPKHKILKYDQFYIDNVAEDDLVLDIGCGNGHLSFAVSQKAKSVEGVDISEKNIKQAREKYHKENITFSLGDATEIKFDQKFDVILLSNVLEHIEKRIDFLNSLHGLSNKIIIRVPMINRDWLTVFKKQNGFEYRLDDSHFIEYTLETLKTELDNSDWKLDSYSIQFGEIWGIVNKKND